MNTHKITRGKAASHNFTAFNPNRHCVIRSQCLLLPDKKAQYVWTIMLNKQIHKHSWNILRQKVTSSNFTAINPEQQHVIRNQYFLLSDMKAQYESITTWNKQIQNHSQNIIRQKGNIMQFHRTQSWTTAHY